jgi:hypothetical protein
MTMSSLIQYDSRDQQIADLKAEIDSLRRDLASAKRAADESHNASVEAHNEAAAAFRALQSLRRQLAPLYKALQMVYGELDAAGVEDSAPSAAGSMDREREQLDTARITAVWQAWKSKLGAGAAKCIDALLLHGEMNTQQLSIATGYHRNTVPQYVSQLNKAGLINKNGGRFSLKHL